MGGGRCDETCELSPREKNRFDRNKTLCEGRLQN